jgi:F0F1-type ATP synthase assembly protein I
MTFNLLAAIWCFGSMFFSLVAGIVFAWRPRRPSRDRRQRQLGLLIGLVPLVLGFSFALALRLVMGFDWLLDFAIGSMPLILALPAAMITDWCFGGHLFSEKPTLGVTGKH